MSYRPRLVESGAPISQDDHDVDAFLDAEIRKQQTLQESDGHDEYHSRNRKAYQSHKSSSHKQSSLISSLGGAASRSSLDSRPREKLQTKIVIGGRSRRSPQETQTQYRYELNLPLKEKKSKLKTSIEIHDSQSHDCMDMDFEQNHEYGINQQEHNMNNAHQSHPQHSANNQYNTSFLSYQHTIHDQALDMHHPMYEHHDRHISIQHSSPIQSERMEVDETGAQRLPLIVIDGANIAYAYTQATTPSSHSKNIEPNVLGINVAVQYFVTAGCRVSVVIPSYWLNRNPKYNSNSTIQASDQIAILSSLKEQNMLMCSPPTDDDDSYCIAIARRIDNQFKNRRKVSSLQSYSHNHYSTSSDLTSLGGAYILSNDLYRDAQQRDVSGNLKDWLDGEDDLGVSKRISYSFADLGSIDQFGDVKLDFVPNPRHPLTAMIERIHRSDSFI